MSATLPPKRSTSVALVDGMCGPRLAEQNGGSRDDATVTEFPSGRALRRASRNIEKITRAHLEGFFLRPGSK